jgi:hypothetical protein
MSSSSSETESEITYPSQLVIGGERSGIKAVDYLAFISPYEAEVFLNQSHEPLNAIPVLRFGLDGILHLLICGFVSLKPPARPADPVKA